MSDLPSREDVQGEGVDDLPTYLQHVLLPLALAWQSGRLVDREAIDWEAAYQQYADEYGLKTPEQSRRIVAAAIGDTE